MGLESPNKNFLLLREKHKSFCYHSCQLDYQADFIQINYKFLLAPDISFTPTLKIPAPQDYVVSKERLQFLAFHLGMIELISYWKASCSRVIRIEAGIITAKDRNFYQKLIFNGLSEFLYRNSIDPNCLEIQWQTKNQSFDVPKTIANPKGELILVAGGKDSSLSLELLKSSKIEPKSCLVLNQTPSSLRSLKIAGLNARSIIVERTIDSNLLDLNQQGYLNGHTPFSAYLAFLSVLVAEIYGLKFCIVSNESSASEGNLLYLSRQAKKISVNHQYSKSFAFETDFNKFAKEELQSSAYYFSLLRGLNELQITKLFCDYPTHLSSFRSCNQWQKRDAWCGECAKCAFVFLMLAAFLDQQQLEQIFSAKLSIRQSIKDQIKALVGLSEHKPFECVGSVNECQAALLLACAKNPGLSQDFDFVKKVNLSFAQAQDLLNSWQTTNLIPKEYLGVLGKESNEQNK